MRKTLELIGLAALIVLLPTRGSQAEPTELVDRPFSGVLEPALAIGSSRAASGL